MESQGPYLSYRLVCRWLLSQDDQFLTRDPEETDSCPSGDEWDTDCQDMLDMSEIHSSARDQNSSKVNSRSYFVPPEHRDSSLVRCHLDSGEYFAAQQRDRDVKNSTVYVSVDDAMVPYIHESDIDKKIVYDSDFQGVCEHDDIPYEETLRELSAPNDQCVYGSDANNAQIVYEQEVLNEHIVYDQGDNNEQLMLSEYTHKRQTGAHEEALHEQSVYMQEDALSDQTVYVKNVQIEQIVYADVQNEHVAYLENGQNEQIIYIEEDAMNDQIVYIEEDAMNDQIVYIEEDAMNDQTVYIEEDSVNDQTVYIEEDSVNNQIVYIEEDSVSEQIGYVHNDDDGVHSEQVLVVEIQQSKQDADYNALQLNQMEGEDFDDDEDGYQNPALSDFVSHSWNSGSFGIEDRLHRYVNYWHGLEQYEIGPDADAGAHKMY